MQKTATISLEDRIIAALMDTSGSLWFPHLTYDLARAGWQRLEKETGVTELDYGTARLVLNNVNSSRNIAFSLLIPNQVKEIKNVVPIEILPKIIIDQYKESGVDFYTAEELFNKRASENELLNCVRDAFNIIRLVPDLFSTVALLVKSIHLIKPESDDYDVSFSEPDIPFSIFISVPQKNSEINSLRVAEAIVHEAMHLQLTLIEGVVKLITSNEKMYYSPWKNEYRTSQGVLHGLYVFRVIERFLSEVSYIYNLQINLINHIQIRHQEIKEQIFEINSFMLHPDLTTIGKNFTKRLINKQITT